ncbi:MAG: amidoligase family protein [Armatimonadetes bacterium]|nr:amidoligase family protein [Armatimonadota bacterium]
MPTPTRAQVIARIRNMIAENRALLNQLSQARDAAALTSGPFEVQTDAGSTLRVDPVSELQSVVSTEAGNAYEVSGNACSCLDNAISGETCDHVRAARLVETGEDQGEAPENVTQNQTGTPGIAEANRGRQRERERVRRARTARERLAAIDDGVMLTTDDDGFKQMYDLVKTGRIVEYEYENVLNGNQNTFGLEIEFTAARASEVAYKLYLKGLCANSSIHSYHSHRLAGYWTVESDASVTRRYRGMNYGGEVVSPVLTDCRQTWEQVEIVCQVIKDCGGKVTEKCGGHVHIGADPLDARCYRWNRLIRIFAGFEDVLYRIAAGGQSKGKLRESAANRYALPVTNRLASLLARRDELSGEEIKECLWSRYFSLNFKNVGTHKNTIEFRLFNGTLDPKQIQANVKLAAGIVHAADVLRKKREETRDRALMIPTEPMPFKSKRVDDDAHLEVRRLLDILFTRKQDKAAVLWLYASSKWQG